mmetsp:Transcript_93584/g.147873  ORF Transcript_93584/g.147873 Transcript_93584/m.147873 type:complete len:82 (-) Transcript_93584:193-438(-)
MAMPKRSSSAASVALPKPPMRSNGGKTLASMKTFGVLRLDRITRREWQNSTPCKSCRHKDRISGSSIVQRLVDTSFHCEGL